MQTTREKLNVLTKRVIAAQEALKLSEKLGPKITVKEAEIKAIQASFDTCPEGQTKSGLAKRLNGLKASLDKLITAQHDAEKTAANAIDLSSPFIAEITDVPAATGTEGGES